MPTISASTQAPAVTNYNRGDSRLMVVPVYKADGKTPFDLTGCEVFFTLNISNAPTNDGTDVTAAIKKSVTTGFLNVFTVTGLSLPLASVPYIALIQLLNTDTQPLDGNNSYNYDIQLKDTLGNITSLSQNTWQIIDDISTRVV